MAENYYKDNSDLQFYLHTLELDDVVRLRENEYSETETYPDAPESYEDALDSYGRVLDMLGNLTADHIAPRADDVDQQGPTLQDGDVIHAEGTQKNLEELRKAQVMGAMLPRQYGGLNLPVTIYTMMNEMVSRADASLQNLFGLQDIAETIHHFGSEDQRERYLPHFASGEADGAMALTEPEAGSDLQAVQLKAHYDDKTDTWYLNGMKRFITNGCAKVLLVLARSEPGTKDGRGLSMFVCEKCPGLVVRRIEDKLGIHGSPTCELQFNNVPAELVGKRRRGLTRYVMSLMNGARVAIASQGLGIAEAAYREGLKYAMEREQFGHPIIKFPAVYEMLTKNKVYITAARALLYETTRYVDLRDCYALYNERTGKSEKEAVKKEKTYTRIAAELTPLAKAFATELANRAAYDTIQIHGGTGFMRDFPAERYYRDARITNIYEGTTQLQYVAAIGGICQRVLEPLMEELSHLPFESKLRRLASKVDVAREKLNSAVEYINKTSDHEYYELVSRRLCDMEMDVFISYLLLRDALHEKDRELIAEQYIADAVARVAMEHDIVTSGDLSMIDNHEDILQLEKTEN